MARLSSWRCAGLVAGLTALVGTAGIAQVPQSLSTTDRQALAVMALRWAVDGGIQDFKLAKDPTQLVVEHTHLPANTRLRVPRHTVTLLSAPRIQARADRSGDFLYFRFGPFEGTAEHASVPISLLWAVSVHSTVRYLSGGGATLSFEKRNGRWQLLPVTSHWVS